MQFQRRSSLPAVLAAAAALALYPGCSSGDTPAPEPVFTIPDIDPVARATSFTVTVDNTDPDLDGAYRQPLSGPVSVQGGADGIGLRAFAKHPPGRPGDLWIELFVEGGDEALRDVSLAITNVKGAASVVDVTNSPLATTPLTGPLPVGGVGKEGLTRVAIALTEPSAEVSIEVSVQGTTTARVAKSSSPIAVTGDGREVWVTFEDANIVAVLDAATNQRITTIEVPTAPSSLAVAPDDKHVLVASRRANVISVIDRASREVIQTITSADGLDNEPRHLVTSADGAHTFVTSYVDDTVARITRRGDRYSLDGRVKVGRRPAGLSVSPNGHSLLVAHFLPRGVIRRNEAWVSAVDGDAMKLVSDLPIHDGFNEDRVACLADVFGVSPSRLTMEGTATALAGVFLSPSGATGWVPGMRVSPGPVMELGPNHEDLGPFTSGVKGRFSPAFLFFVDARAGAESMRSPGVLDIPNVNLDYVRCAEPELDIEFTTGTVLPDGRHVNPAVASPNGNAGLNEEGRLDAVAFSRGGRRAIGVSSLADEVVVYDAATLHPATQRHLLLSGANPYGIALSPDGARAYVAYRNSTYVSVLDTSAYSTTLPEPAYVPFELAEIPELGSAQSAITSRWLVRDVSSVPDLPAITEVATIPLVEKDPLSDIDRRGRILFSSSSPVKYPELTESRQATCATCHPDGGSDGAGWATVEGERRTLSLRGGVAGRGWLHASGTHRGIEEFVKTVVEQRLGGSPDPDTVDALSRYVAFGVERLQGPKVDKELAAKGAKVFEASCKGCHSGSALSSGNPDPSDPLGGGRSEGPFVFDVGTRSDGAGILFGSFFESIFPPAQSQMLKLLRGDRDLGAGDPLQSILDFEPRPERGAGELKAPSLIGAWDQVVFFHDGRYDSLDDAIEHLNDELGLGLSDSDRAAVIEHLKTL